MREAIEAAREYKSSQYTPDWKILTQEVLEDAIKNPGKWAQPPTARSILAGLEAAGHQVTYNAVDCYLRRTVRDKWNRARQATSKPSA